MCKAPKQLQKYNLKDGRKAIMNRPKLGLGILTSRGRFAIFTVFITRRCIPLAKKMGRPTDNPKLFRVNVRLDAESKEILDAYVKQEGITAMEAARRGIKKLKDDLKDALAD